MPPTHDRSRLVGVEQEPLRRSVECGTCGYDLRGLTLGGRCPECGSDVWGAVIGIIDPAASRLPQIRRPRVVADGLLTTVALLLLSVAIGTFFVYGGVFGFGPPWRGVLAALPGGCMLLGAVAALQLAPPAESEADTGVRRAVIRLTILLIITGIGLAVLGQPWGGPAFRWQAGIGGSRGPAIEMAPIFLVASVVVCGGFSFALLALRQVVVVVGERSRMFRTARGGRQRIRDLVVATVVLGCAEAAYLYAVHDSEPGFLGIGAVAAMVVTLLMLVIGLAYLTVNMIWIRRAILRPPPTLRELLTPEIDETPGAGPDAEVTQDDLD